MELDVSITICYEISTWESTFMTVKVSLQIACMPAGVHSAVTNMQ